MEKYRIHSVFETALESPHRRTNETHTHRAQPDIPCLSGIVTTDCFCITIMNVCFIKWEHKRAQNQHYQQFSTDHKSQINFLNGQTRGTNVFTLNFMRHKKNCTNKYNL